MITKPHAAIRAALEKRLATLPGIWPTVAQNTSCEPVDGVPYQRVAVLFATPDDMTMGRALTRHHGIFQVSLMYMEGEGTYDAEQYASAIAEHFKPPMTLVEGDLKVQLTETVNVVSGFSADSRYVVPVSIPWACYISR